MAKIKLTNRLRQGLPILLRNAQGKMQSWILPMMGTRVISDSEMSQDVLDKETRGYLRVEAVEEKKAG